MPHRLTLGISEDADRRKAVIPSVVFQDDGPYAAALEVLDSYLATPAIEKIHESYWDRAIRSGSTLPAANFTEARLRHRRSIRWIMVLEAEQARLWREGPLDYLSALREYHGSAAKDAKRLMDAISELRRLDKRHAYLLRHSLQHAMQDFLADGKVRRVRVLDPNLKNGYAIKTVSGPNVRESEFQYLTKLSLFDFQKLLDSWTREIETVFRPWKRPWMEFGALLFDGAISPRSAAKMNVVQLGLLARLASRMRDFTAGYGIRAYSRGQPVPSQGKPCWGIVAEFINCALARENSLTGESAQRIWNKFAATHNPTMQTWPNPAKQESQYHEI